MVLNIVLGLTGAAAVAALVLEYGGFAGLKETYGHALHVAQGAILGMLILDRAARLALSERRLEYLRRNWIEFALILALLIAIVIVSRLRGRFLSAGALYVAITQAYIFAVLILHGLSANVLFADSGIHPTWMLIGSFAIMCLVGSGLLMLPAARSPTAKTLYYDDALFTAVSATCVTGLVVADTGTDYSGFGQAVILVLIQLGGLGIMLFGTMMAMLIGKGLTIRGSDTIGRMVGTDGIGELTRAIKFVVCMTLVMEIIGAASKYPMFAGGLDGHNQPLSTAGAIWHSTFHSISSFCNAGFSLYRDNMMHDVGQGAARQLRGSWQIFGVMAPLIVLGGLGFPVLQDLGAYARRALRRLCSVLGRARPGPASSGPRLCLHSKVVPRHPALCAGMR